MTIIKRCDCKTDSRGSTRGAKFQDRQYGEGMRLWTEAGGTTDKSTARRCTVCGRKESQ